ncbi:hypothetical protein KL938_003829 [Ogataea parapolymorpha]|nr:hypothetical protein KL938_003829 [Ogataea parapolymorpha]
MRCSLRGKTVLITGASAGIGLETARAFADEAEGDIRLVLTARRIDRLENTKTGLEEQYPRIKIFVAQLDIQKPDAVRQFVLSLPQEFSEIDILINNAGVALGRDPVGTVDPAAVQTMLDTNVLGLITLTQETLPGMRKRNRGDIVNVGSIAGRASYPGGAIYCATKAAVKYFTRSLRKELLDTKIRVMEVVPGAVDTELQLVRHGGVRSELEDKFMGDNPLEAVEIADFIVYACTRRETSVIAEAIIVPTYQSH